jgi:YD repeat-containing protein
MNYIGRTLCFIAFIFSSCLSSEGDLSEFPAAKITSVKFTDTFTNDDIEGTLQYEGDPGSPSKITVTWSGDLPILRIPITDTKKITKTIYEFENGQIVRITNVNDAGVDARVEEFTYDQDGYLTEHFLKEINVGGTGFFTYKNLFYYDPDYNLANVSYDNFAGALQRVIQTRCNNVNTCYDGVFDFVMDDSFKSHIPATIAKTSGDPREFLYTSNPSDVSDFSGGSCLIKRSSGSIETSFNMFVPHRVENRGVFGQPQRIGYDEGYGLIFSQGNVEYLAQVYYALGQWLNPAYNLVDATYDDRTGNYLLGATYGRDNTSWVFPRLNMATSYANYITAGGQLQSSERTMNVDFKTEIID